MSTSVDPAATGVRRWHGLAALALAVPLFLGFAVLLARVPWPNIDLSTNLLRAENLTWRETVRVAFASGVEYRPLLLIANKFVYDLAGLHLWFYKALVLLQILAVLWALLLLFRPSNPNRLAASIVALACGFGLHTSRSLFLFLPLNAYSLVLIMVLGAAVCAVEPGGQRREWFFIPLVVCALLALEIGILILPIALAAWWLGAPATTWRSVGAALVGVAIYSITRYLFGASVGDLASPESGLGFDDVSPQQIKLTFQHAPWLFWLYNIASSFLTIAVSEPRAGKFKFIHAVLHGNDAPWQWLHVLSSLVTTVTIVAVLSTGNLAKRDRVLAACGLVLLVGGSVLGFLYTRDRIPLAAGFGYSILLFVAAAVLLERASTSSTKHVLAVALVAALGVSWLWRVGEGGVQLRDRAWSFYLEWTTRYHVEGPEPPLLQELRRRVVSHRPPDPRRDPVWTYRWFEREFNRAGS